MFETFRRELSMVEVIAWIEGAAHLQAPPPSEHALHRQRIVFHAGEREVLCRAQS